MQLGRLWTLLEDKFVLADTQMQAKFAGSGKRRGNAILPAIGG